MRIVNLIENTPGAAGCAAEHGLSFYVETPRHRLLMDAGPSESTLENAQRLGISLKSVDTLVLSHGHYDHSGGILPFARINRTAAIYIQRAAFSAYYSIDRESDPARYIGIDPGISGLGSVVPVDGCLTIDEELSLFTMTEHPYPIPSTNSRLRMRENVLLVPDTFAHDQALAIHAEGRHILLSGCAHNGILNVLANYRRLYGGEPDLVISGFHLMKNGDYTEDEKKEIDGIAEALMACRGVFVTGHCTGVPAYQRLKAIMGDKLRYAHSGEEISLN